MLLWCAPSETVGKDAARAVKRVANLDVQEVTAETLSALLGLPGMKVTRFAIEEQDGGQYLHCSASTRSPDAPAVWRS